MSRALSAIRNLSVWQQLLICLAVTSAIFSLLFGYTLRSFESDFLLSHIKRSDQQTVALITATSADAIITEDRPVLERAINDVAKTDNSIAAIRIFNEDEIPLAEWRSSTVLTKTPIVISKDIVVANETFGRVVLEWNADAIEQQAQSHSASMSYLYALSLVIFSLAMLGVLTFMITRPLSAFRAHIAHISSGNLTETVSLQTNREVKALSESLNMLSSMLRKKQDDENLHRELLIREHELELMAENRAKEDALGALEKAVAANTVKSAFLTSMSHELRTPLNAIIGYGEMLEEEAAASGNERSRADLNKLLSAGRHLLSLINDVLDLSKIEAGKMELALTTFDLGALIIDSMHMIEPLLARGHNRLEQQISVGGVMMHSDAVRIRQVIFNLLSNACKFTTNGVITLSAWCGEGEHHNRVIISVRDTGMGMAPKDLERLFQPFTQVAPADRKSEGAGLGLALCRHFCALMGGEISVSSILGQGTELTFWLPIGSRSASHDTDMPAERAAAR